MLSNLDMKILFLKERSQMLSEYDSPEAQQCLAELHKLEQERAKLGQAQSENNNLC